MILQLFTKEYKTTGNTVVQKLLDNVKSSPADMKCVSKLAVESTTYITFNSSFVLSGSND